MPTSETTAGVIDAFESRLTTRNGGHFLVSANGRHAWPISAGEAAEFRALFRRWMGRARWIRRLAIIGFLPLMALASKIGEDAPNWLKNPLGYLGIALLLLPFAGMIAHMAIGDLTNRAIERRMARRFTTDPDAVTPPPTSLGELAQRLFLFTILGEIAIGAIHLFTGTEGLAQHMRVLWGQAAGNEGTLAWVTGTIGRFLPAAVLAATLFAAIDRRRRRKAAEQAEKAEAGSSADPAPRPLTPAG